MPLQCKLVLLILCLLVSSVGRAESNRCQNLFSLRPTAAAISTLHAEGFGRKEIRILIREYSNENLELLVQGMNANDRKLTYLKARIKKQSAPILTTGAGSIATPAFVASIADKNNEASPRPSFFQRLKSQFVNFNRSMKRGVQVQPNKSPISKTDGEENEAATDPTDERGAWSNTNSAQDAFSVKIEDWRWVHFSDSANYEGIVQNGVLANSYNASSFWVRWRDVKNKTRAQIQNEIGGAADSAYGDLKLMAVAARGMPIKTDIQTPGFEEGTARVALKTNEIYLSN